MTFQAGPGEPAAMAGMRVRVRGLVQGVGFRPAVWRLARECGLRGEVRNDSAGVLIEAWGGREALTRFVERLAREAPPLARIDSIDADRLAAPASREGAPDFRIAASAAGEVHTAIGPDAATCAACAAEVDDPSARRYRHAFANCTHCGPRFSIVRAIPYDRRNTSMAAFGLCSDCEAEYRDPANRRFHAQPIACARCGPRVWVEAAGRAGDAPVVHPPTSSGRTAKAPSHDWLEAAAALIEDGAILAVKGLGGFHLACDATNAAAVERLRARKRRDRKPFALLAPDLETIERYCFVSEDERALLRSAAAPIVLLERRGEGLPQALAPGVSTLGFMLPYTPLHRLLARAAARPLVLTSGNLSDEPQCITDAHARVRLAGLADAWILHDREIVNRVDDSVARVMDGAARIVRRARGYAPAPLALPRGFERAPALLAMGAMLKNTFCLTKDAEAIVSQHQGDLEHAAAFEDYRRQLTLYRELFEHEPELVAVDAHPEYLSTRLGIEYAERHGLAVITVQHHHAHIASCLAENGTALDAPRVLGIALDGLGMGEDGALWGGEFLLADYRGFTRMGRLAPVALPGGERAMHEPWRNAYAHLAAAIGWRACRKAYGGLELVRFLEGKPLSTLDAMIACGLNAPPASSGGRLFDAVAAAVGLCRERAAYEGEPAIALEAAARGADADGSGYAFGLREDRPLTTIDPAPMWRALLDDLARGVDAPRIAARFHEGLARALCDLAGALARRHAIGTVALSGGVFQNRTLFERTAEGLRARGLQVLAHRQMPPNDGGLALGQAVVAAACALEKEGRVRFFSNPARAHAVKEGR